MTDFGMAKLAVLSPRNSFTKCPGADVYMPPEAVKEKPVYSERMDSFSLGVIIVQLLTRIFPKPGERQKTVSTIDPCFPTVQVAVSEIERRHNHINEIDPNNPLLRVALDCLQDEDVNRPSAQRICNRLAVLKTTDQYMESVRNKAEQERRMKDLKEQLDDRQQQIESLQQEHVQLLQEYREHMRALNTHIREMELQCACQIRENQELREFLKTQENPPQSSKGLLEPKQGVDHQWIQTLRHSKAKREEQSLTSNARLHLTLPTKGKMKSSQLSLLQPSFELSWRKGKKAPRRMYGTKYAVCRSTAYFMIYGDIYAYDWKSDSWTQLPNCPHLLCSLAVICDLPTAIGGQLPGRTECTNKLISLTGDENSKKWEEIFPHMPTKRDSSTALCFNTALIVAGGTTGGKAGDIGRVLKTVEVMNTNTFHWTNVAELPCPLYDSTATVCDNRIYMVGGWDSSSTSVTHVHTCSMTALLQSCQLSTQSKLPHSSIWRQVANVPVRMCPCVTLQNCLVVIGGKNSTDKPTKAVHLYNEAKDSWEIISHVQGARHDCLAVVFSETVLMIVGGLAGGRVTDTVAFATVV